MRKNEKREELEFWNKKLIEYQKKYDELIRQSSERWWHDEYFDIQIRVLESLIVDVEEKIKKLKRKKNEKI